MTGLWLPVYGIDGVVPDTLGREREGLIAIR